ncbi:MFS transporter [Stackebrandtia soli]|uniref:MFS transporter n=1 Tax=Stackebrandtia soli TaxID=1892856 RepID=UPI0039E8906A
MLSVLRHPTYRYLFIAQVIALVGTGLATVSLGLLAYDIAGGGAAAVLGTALAIKMVANVVIAPLVTAVADRLPRRTLMVTMDLGRAAVAVALPFATEIWHVYALIFVLQAASATFTPTFQSTIPQVLPDERDYTKALTLSRLAYDIESLLSPALAAVLLTMTTYDWLFGGTTLGFIASAILVTSCVLPKPVPMPREGGVRSRAMLGSRRMWATPRLRAALSLNLAVASAGALILVDTVLIVREHFGMGNGAVSLALAAYGLGSMFAALLLSRLLAHARDRTVMLIAAGTLPISLSAAAIITAAEADAASWIWLLAIWAVIGAATAAVTTPIGRVIRRSTEERELPAVFAAQFSLSHACWLLTYPLAGWLTTIGNPVAAGTLAVVALGATAAAAIIWPTADPSVVEHVHTRLTADDPHLADAESTVHGWRHRHEYVVNPQHPRWPRTAAGHSVQDGA